MNSNSNAGQFRVWQALAASLALHALLLAQPHPAARLALALRPLAATLREAVADRAGGQAAAAALAPPARRPLPAAAASPRVAPALTPTQTAGSGQRRANEDAAEAAHLRAYRFGLAQAARGVMDHARAAISGNLAGRVELRLDISAGGSALPPRVIASSGSPLLDAAAVDLVARAAQVAPVPEALRGAAFSVNLPLEFDPGER